MQLYFLERQKKKKQASVVISAEKTAGIQGRVNCSRPQTSPTSTLSSVSTASGFPYCLQYFQFPLKCLAWQVLQPFPLQLQACGVSQMGLLKK